MTASTSQVVRQGAWLNSSLLCDVIFYHVISEFGYTGSMHGHQNRKQSARRRGCMDSVGVHRIKRSCNSKSCACAIGKYIGKLVWPKLDQPDRLL